MRPIRFLVLGVMDLNGWQTVFKKIALMGIVLTLFAAASTQTVSASDSTKITDFSNLDNNNVWESYIINKPLAESIIGIDLNFGAGSETEISKVAIVDITQDKEITSYVSTMAADKVLDYHDFDNGLLITSGRVVSIRLYFSDNRSSDLYSLTIKTGTVSEGWDTERITGAVSVQRSANRVSITWTGPDSSLIRWDFGDGEGAAGETVSHTYDEPGNYTIAVYAHYDDGSVLWSEVPLMIEHWGTIAEINAGGMVLTFTNSMMYASGFIMIGIAVLFPTTNIIFNWNTPRLRLGLGLVLVLIATLFTAGMI